MTNDQPMPDMPDEYWRDLQAQLDELERTDPAVAKAAQRIRDLPQTMADRARARAFRDRIRKLTNGEAGA